MDIKIDFRERTNIVDTRSGQRLVGFIVTSKVINSLTNYSSTVTIAADGRFVFALQWLPLICLGIIAEIIIEYSITISATIQN